MPFALRRRATPIRFLPQPLPLRLWRREPRAPVEADQTTPSLASADNLIAQAFPRRVVRSGRQGTSLAGNVQIAGSPVAGAKVTLYAAGTGAPAELAEGQTNGDGAFQLGGGPAPRGRVFYVVAKGGASKAAHAKVPNEAIRLMVVLGGTLPRKVTVNEFTTIASVVTCEQFLKGEALERQIAWAAHRGRQRPQFRGSRNRRLRCHNRRRAEQRRRRPRWRTSPRLPACWLALHHAGTAGRVQPIPRRSDLTDRHCPDGHLDGG